MQPRRRLYVLAVLAGSLMLPAVVHAQMVPGDQSGRLLNPTPKAAPKEVPPPALPGAAERQGAVAPAEKPASEMSPNEALFDAINRGDVAAAHDALSRGAQLDAHNVLGLTPMELAVDLGRSDIAFLLLSMRGEAGGGGSSAAPRQAAASAIKPPPSPARAAKRPAVVAKAAPMAAPAAPAQPTLFAHDGGAPIPGIGFLGFDPQRATP